MSKIKHIDPALIELLEESEKPYSIIEGTKHLKVRVCGRLVLVLPRKESRRHGSQVENARSSLRRHLRAIA